MFLYITRRNGYQQGGCLLDNCRRIFLVDEYLLLEFPGLGRMEGGKQTVYKIDFISTYAQSTGICTLTLCGNILWLID
jgi:hypothetical protein